jgi:hypothetical protein
MSINIEARKLVNEAFSLLGKGEVDAGALLVEQARRISPDDVKVLNASGVILLKKGNSWSAVQILWLAVKWLEDAIDKGAKDVYDDLAVIENNLLAAVKSLEKEGLAHLTGRRPARAKEIFYQALQFSLENPRLRKNLVFALEANDEREMAFRCAKSLVLDIIESQEMSSIAIEKLQAANKLFIPAKRDLAFKSAKESLSQIIKGLQANTGNLSTLKKVILIFVS